MTAKIIVISLLILLFIVSVSWKKNFEILEEFAITVEVPESFDLKEIKDNQWGNYLLDNYIHSVEEYQAFKNMLVDQFSADVSILPEKFDWINYCLYSTSWTRLVEISYSPIIDFFQSFFKNKKPTPEVFESWCKFENKPHENTIFIYIGEKIPHRARRLDRFHPDYKYDDRIELED